ncbi:MAG TPA: TauD/TfdA family dioxygenase [Alphaproteobacteria bacterium]|nr:TauD/TfdA family dioxygenase [Alphaproteobacteria bacterium]
MIATARLPATFGVEVDFDLRQAPTPAEAAELRNLMAEHGLLLFRGHTLTGAEQMGAAACFGRVSCDGGGRPMEMHVSNTRQSSAPAGELIFHYDYAYDPDPITVISLYGEEIGAGSTPTLFASSAKAFDALPPRLRHQVETLSALHLCVMDRAAPAAERAAMTGARIERGQPGWGPKDWRNIRPLVWQSQAGVKSLYACLQHTMRIMELPIGESDALLAELFDHLYAPKNVYTHDWQPDDLVVWDNITVQHCRPKPNDVPRTLRRYEVSDIDLTEQYLAVGRANKFL